MYTQNPPTTRLLTPLTLVIVVFFLGLFVWRPFVMPKDEATGKQLQLPFKDIEESKKPEPKGPKATPYPYARRYDENRLGTCIIYAFRASVDGSYNIPGCYGKPSNWLFVEEGTILKVGRHWNPTIKNGCNAISSLEAIVRKKRYGSDKKFPLGRIMTKIDGKSVNIPMDIVISDCIEQVTERDCENLEKTYIKQHGGAKKLLLNCCCR